ncbi:MAG: hypothetical protein U9R21_06675, partial [Candidatus Thermoplasmatota archaeon]|nr:hypothetical protein [Candidatus Thermoplasmatota archaeon]
AQTVGGHQNMYVADCSVSVSLYRMPLGDIVATEPLPAEKGYGASANNAGLNGYSKVEPQVRKIVEQMLSRL